MISNIKRHLLEYLDEHPLQRGLIFSLMGKAYPIFIDYPVNIKPRYGHGNLPHEKLHEIINRNRDVYRVNLMEFLKYKDNFIDIPARQNKNKLYEPAWINGWLPGLDSIALYGFLSLNNPRRYVEIGSGNSTKFARRAITDNKLKTKITSIDPHPRAEIDVICDEVIRHPLEEVDLTVFEELGKNDIVFVDSSHCSFMNSDVTVFFLEVLPKLRSGVIVEFHDINLPLDYSPRIGHRYYSEQYLLAAYLLANDEKFNIIFPGMFISTDPELKKMMDPLWRDPKMEGVEQYGGSFWIEIR